MILTPAQNEIAADLHRFRVVNCGRRFGKTTLAIEEIKGKVLARASKVAYIAPTFQQARDIAWEALKAELRPILASVNESRLELRVRNLEETESLVVLRGWEAIETLRGQHFDFIVIDEVASMRNFWLLWQEVIRPTLTDTKGEVLFISTPKGFNHFYDLYCLEAKDSDYKSFHFTSYDNLHIPKDELDKAKRELTEDRFSQEYMADFRKTEGLVYKEFDRRKHVYNAAEASMRPVRRLLGIDWGYTNPAAVLTIEEDYDATYWVTGEWYKRGKTTEEIAEYAASLGANAIYPDPAEPDRVQELAKRGMNVRDVNKDVASGIDAVRTLFKNGKIKINSDCVNLIHELETYTYAPKKPDQNEKEEPIKENDHALDALRYVIFMQAAKTIGAVAHQFIPSNSGAYRRRSPNPSKLVQSQ